ncbi:hypothetical protein Van01_27220 [Micromonospora andamanensis]|uniref:Uncharacterized protein n=2 Tax=Micromonospora andamanensis TaxID=1287068 RepID=A0ABQ4HV20_9ACTN|nr:hypothetical protein Van01_27220 [Micromonospora andamanensis]
MHLRSGIHALTRRGTRKTGGDGGMQRQDSESVSEGEQVEAAERAAAMRRLLEQAEAERVPVEETTRAVPDRRWRREQR